MTDDLTLYRVITGGIFHEKPWKRIKILRKVDAVQSYLRNQMLGDAYAQAHDQENDSYTKVHTVTIRDEDWQEWVNPDEDKLRAELAEEAEAMRKSFENWKDWYGDEMQ
jgi:hypothetical protein